MKSYLTPSKSLIHHCSRTRVVRVIPKVDRSTYLEWRRHAFTIDRGFVCSFGFSLVINLLK